MEGIKDLIENDDVSIQQILNNLMSGKKNLELKTEIPRPRQLAGLFMLATSLKKDGYPITAKTIFTYIRKFMEYMVSKDRNGRKEIISAISNLNNKNLNENISFNTKLD